MTDRRVAWLLALGPDGAGVTMRVWSGNGDLTFGGETYRPVAALRVSDIVLDGSPPEVTITLPVQPDARDGWLSWSGSVPGVFQYLHAVAGAWEALGPRLVGRVNDPQLHSVDGVEAVDIPLRTAPVRDRPVVRNWSPEAQAARFPGDIGFALLRESVTVRSRWPN